MEPEAGLVDLDFHQHESSSVDDAVDPGIERRAREEAQDPAHHVDRGRVEDRGLHPPAELAVHAKLARRRYTTEAMRERAAEEHPRELALGDLGHELLQEHPACARGGSKTRERVGHMPARDALDADSAGADGGL